MPTASVSKSISTRRQKITQSYIRVVQYGLRRLARTTYSAGLKNTCKLSSRSNKLSPTGLPSVKRSLSSLFFAHATLHHNDDDEVCFTMFARSPLNPTAELLDAEEDENGAVLEGGVREIGSARGGVLALRARARGHG